MEQGAEVAQNETSQALSGVENVKWYGRIHIVKSYHVKR